MGQKISVKSPTRVDLAGGTLDLWPLYNFVGNAKTINIAIDIYTYVELEIRETPEIEVESADVNLKKFYSHISNLISDSDPQVAFFKTHIEYWMPTFGFKLKTRSESPVGGGLGGSSSLTISLLKAFSKAMMKPFRDPHEMVKVAHNLEAKMLFTPTGTQDYYPAITGGVGILSFDADGIKHRTVKVDQKKLNDRFLLAYTGKAHHSGLNNFEVLKGAVEKKKTVIKALVAIKHIAEQMAYHVENENWNELKALFNKEFEARIQLAESFSSPEIEKLREISLNAGAEAVKICGAGGGGCVLVWCTPEGKSKIALEIEKSGFKVLPTLPAEDLHWQEFMSGQN